MFSLDKIWSKVHNGDAEWTEPMCRQTPASPMSYYNGLTRPVWPAVAKHRISTRASRERPLAAAGFSRIVSFHEILNSP